MHDSLSEMGLPGIVDLFSGCGGLAAGFDHAGYSIDGGADMDFHSAQTASYNLAYRYGRNAGHICRDLTRLTAADLPISDSPSGYIVVGGPPCQAYSRAGRGKLRSLGEHHLDDPRGMLYRDYIRLCLEIGVEAVVMENVPEAIDYGGVNIPESVSCLLEQEGYVAGWTILNAADYGVPQVRERMILIALKKGYCDGVTFPQPTHAAPFGVTTPWGLRKKRLEQYPHFKSVGFGGDECREWVTVGDALSDLPRLFPAATSRYRLLQPSVLLPYSGSPQNDFQEKMRMWYGKSLNHVSGHSFRNTARDFPIFEQMSHGDDFRQVATIAQVMLDKACVECGVTADNDPERYQSLLKRIVPPYARDKFHEKWKRLDPSKPSHTLVAHLATDTYSHIHPWEPRGISVREAARLQSFPDGFQFSCPMSEAFRQIGNAVPPLLSLAIANHLKTVFTGAVYGPCV